jgi:hypothetical protein
LFYGADGLRAGWSLLVFFVLYAAMAFSALKVAKMLHPSASQAGKGGTVSLGTTFFGDAITLGIALLVSWIMAKIERRPFAAYGLGGERKLPRLLAGLAWGVSFLSLLVFGLWKAGLLVIDGRGLFGSDILRYSVAWLAAFLLIAITEEFLFRGYLQYTLSRGLAGMFRTVFKLRHSTALGFWSAAVTWAVLFGFVHKGNPGESPIGLVCASLAALLFCLSLWRTGSLWWAIGLHATWDYAQSFLYGVGDSGLFMRQRLLLTHPAGSPLLSGGGTGPEGSAFVLPVMALIALAIVFTLPRSKTSYLPEHAPVA